VLVVDDSLTTRTLLKSILGEAGYRVTTAADGEEAWQLLRSESFSLVLSDVQMPRVDGLELTSRIRSSQQLAQLPVVLVTALGSDQERQRGLNAGASAYVVKSAFDPQRLLQVVARHV
jgi:two-component system chemotaxis sensor kinase CheA